MKWLTSLHALSPSLQRVRALFHRSIPQKPVGLKAETISFIVLNVVGVLFLAGDINYQFRR